MLGLGASLLSPYVADAGYVNTHSLSLDGTGTGDDTDFLDTNTTLQAQLRESFSISMWVKLDDGQPNPADYFAGSVVSGNQVAFTLLSTGKLNFVHFSNSDIALYSTDAVIFSNGANDWTHIGITVTKRFMGGDTAYKIYVNGSESAGTKTLGVSGPNHDVFTTSANFAFGATGSTGQGTDGLIDECAFFDGVLTDEEMLAIGGGGAPTDITGHDHLYLYYKLNNNTNDEVGNSNGTLKGQAAFSTTTP